MNLQRRPPQPKNLCHQKQKRHDIILSDSSEDELEEPKQRSLDVILSDSSEDEFEEPKRKKKTENLPQTSTPERKQSKRVHVASDTEDMPTLHSHSMKKKKGVCSTASPQESPIKNDSSDLPDIPVTDTDEGKCTDENKRDDDDEIMKEFEEMMQQRQERQLFAQSSFLYFPTKDEPQVQLCVVYESHGGLAINRPFKLNDTVKSVFSWICVEIDPEILPPVFHLECRTPTNCPNPSCPHIYELKNNFKVKVGDLPNILYLREGYFATEETFTGFGDVLM
ncbi:uncharacterized protein LOC133199174 [Saccostrea echinata]|uniref:uncharacterized protein LOC133199174 n=1 Tax=Saccostrea echinata TaxID=191078 RepID=UPI002A80EF69|nr:uncharacterized protein LOC133199174 [Saccostrea echinata]